MSRRAIQVLDDPDCVIGWDRGLQTYFFTSGRTKEEDAEEPAVWLGLLRRELQSIDELESALHTAYRLDKCEIPQALADALRADREGLGRSTEAEPDTLYVLDAEYTELTEDPELPRFTLSR